MGDLEWLENLDLFKEKMDEGRPWEAYVAARLIVAGVGIHVPARKHRSESDPVGAYADHGDIWAGDKLLEVKSRALHFTSISDFPHAEGPYVDQADKYRKRRELLGLPFAYVIVSQQTGGILCVSGRSHLHWWEKRGFDRTRGERSWMVCPPKWVRTFEELLPHLAPS